MDDRELLARPSPDIEHEVTRIADEFRAGFERVALIDRPAVAMFGSARVGQEHPAYVAARETARLFGERDWAVITGGGPGVMEAGNRGAQEGGGQSVGFNIELPHEQGVNAYCDRSLTFKHFYARKTMLVKAAEGFVLCEGGFGTLDELFESLVLIQTGKIRHFPVVLVGSAHWGGLRDWIEEKLIAQRLISPDDVLLLSLTDDPAEAIRIVLDCYEQNCAAVVEDVEAAAS